MCPSHSNHEFYELPWSEIPFVILDTETTGAYPIESEICEIALIKVKGRQILETYSTLICPNQIMGEKVIGIHGITNEMVATAPKLEAVIDQVASLLHDSVLVAHHAPFDMGFVARALEICKKPLPQFPAVCSSLLARALITDSPNHKLQTLIPHLGLPLGQAHRALDDAQACWGVAEFCFQKLGPQATLAEIQACQQKDLRWPLYSIQALKERDSLSPLIEATEASAAVEIVYQGGSHAGQPRTIYPVGIVRNPDGDYVVARGPGDSQLKRFYLEKIKESRRLLV